jgi:hypothetical protein
MSQTWHIFRKDLRRLRWAFVAWIFVIIGHLLLTTAGAAAETEGIGVELVVQNLTALIRSVELLMWGLLVSWIIHDEPLVGSDAFWLTRPIERGALMTAKLVLAGVVLLFVPLAGKLVAIVWFGASPHDVVLAAPTVLFDQALWVSLLLAVAAVTPSLARFVLTVAGGIAAFAVSIATVTTVVVLTAPEENPYYEGAYVPDSTAGIVGSALLMCVALGVLAYQYRHRWLSRAILIAAAGVVGTMVVTSVWPWHFARAAERDPGPWAHDSARTPAVLDPGRPPNISEVESLRRVTRPKKQVAARVDLAGAPPEYSVESIGIRAQLTFPDGTTLQSAQRGNVGLRRASTGQPSERGMRLQAVLGNVRLSPKTDENYETLPVVLKATDADYARYGEQAGRLTATVDFHLKRFRAFGSVPLAAGAAVRDATDRLEVLRVLRRSDGCDVVVRQFTVVPLWTPPSRREFHFVLRNTGRGEALDGDTEGMTPIGGFSPGGFLGWSVEGNSPGFSVWTHRLRYPARAASAAGASRIDGTWLDGAELLVIESADAGHVTRSLTVDGFRMKPADR